ncbi:response regulator [Hominisplanchenecus murintestinalis]|jgi:YesN/AraC family two-component response regulator|uniref:Response regulator n=1 Tax=Hominisplanchenecus murintestinalis TaxID=2941517 RepID=A0AC61R071_9FIRM|nr:response regulator [Hominisplanchenecus murintestinalis]NBH98374.1 response regulator [Lachnospiraceae bacterium]NBI75616.1 response regulator [Lachnospiraceae bacterium]RKJ90990.1 response regulator [Anaerotruncus sp. 1XD22-93]TGX98930.1 response regulator [Hominisplanchenecus murintestinalis]
MNVLIADDNQIVLNNLKSMIDWERLGFSICQTAADGADALEKILNEKPDIVLLDIRMPQKNGIEVIRESSARGFTGKVILLSEISNAEQKQAAKRCGISFCLSKPVSTDELKMALAHEAAAIYAERFFHYIQSHNRTMTARALKDLGAALRDSGAGLPAARHLLANIYIMIKKKILLLPSRMKIPFLSNAAAAELLENKSSLNEIMQFLAEQFELWTNSVGCFTGENVMDEVLYYIQQNYDQRLSLEILAPIFGYNSSYLGKLFRKTTGIGFNAYLDQVRIGAAKQLLVQENLKNYEIAGKVGYRGVDYFHKKFKKYTGTTPAEYRRRETGEN